MILPGGRDMRSGDIQLICKVIDPFGTDEELADILSTL